MILWIRLEILNYKYGEGFVKVWKKWWKNKQQGETYENEEFGINFQRINMILLYVDVAFTFYTVQNPAARKYLKNIITGSRETVQIIRM